MGAKIRLNSKAFAAQLARLKAQSKRSFAVVLAEQMKGFVREVISVTPPGKPSKKGESGPTPKARGTRAVAKDIRQVMVGTTTERRIEETDVAAVHARFRSPKDGRTRRQRNRVRVPADILRQYIRAKQSHVGKLAAGWNAAAQKVGYRPPTWISRHAGQGQVQVRASGDRLRFRATNATRYASDQYGLERRIQVGLYVQANRIKRRVDSKIAEDAAKAGLTAKP